jgi:hypothetical protein
MILELIERLAREAQSRKLAFLLIGGQAVTRLGHARMTLDIDILVRSDDLPSWAEALKIFGYSCYSEGNAFAQFSGQTGWPRIDLMLVDNPTFEKLAREAFTFENIPVPSARHMVALKLHAASSPTRSKPAQDWEDIRQMVLLHHLDLDEQEFQKLILRYGGESALEKIRALCKAE